MANLFNKGSFAGHVLTLFSGSAAARRMEAVSQAARSEQTRREACQPWREAAGGHCESQVRTVEGGQARPDPVSGVHARVSARHVCGGYDECGARNR